MCFFEILTQTTEKLKQIVCGNFVILQEKLTLSDIYTQNWVDMYDFVRHINELAVILNPQKCMKI
ncbi:MAG: hypothetical protein EAZ75_10745 [Flavobacteriia bacterium]|nr:MAG: hypothetical protein EAZ75_10745 [Flavobacteriia bacterium]